MTRVRNAMMRQNRDVQESSADILFEYEEVVVGNRPFSLRDYEEELRAASGTMKSELGPAFYTAGLREISALDEF